MSLSSSYTSSNVQFLCVRKEKHAQKILIDAVNVMRFSLWVCWRSRFPPMWRLWPSASNGRHFEDIWNIGKYLPNYRSWYSTRVQIFNNEILLAKTCSTGQHIVRDTELFHLRRRLK